MNRYKWIIVILNTFVLLSISCKKKTDIEVEVFNYALNEPVAGAEVSLIERKNGVGDLRGRNSSCEIVETKTTDSEGGCFFSEKKLKRNSKYDYFVTVTKAYGQDQIILCESKTSGFIKKGGQEKLILNSTYHKGRFFVQCRNLFQDSELNDSLFIAVVSPTFKLPDYAEPLKGGVIQFLGSVYKGQPVDPSLTFKEAECMAGWVKLLIYKKKNSLSYNIVDSFQVRPNQTIRKEVLW